MRILAIAHKLLRATRGRSRARPRCDGAPRGPGTKRRPRVVCWTGEHVPLLRFARGVASPLTRARVDLEPRIRTSVPHTWFLQGDHPAWRAKAHENPYIVALSLGRTRSHRKRIPCIAGAGEDDHDPDARFHGGGADLLEGDAAQSVAAVRSDRRVGLPGS